MKRASSMLTLVVVAGCGGATQAGAAAAEPAGARERSAATQQRGGVQVGTADPARAGGPLYAEDYDYEPLLFGWPVNGAGAVGTADVVAARRHPEVRPEDIAAFTGEACRGIPPGSRSACPLLIAPSGVKPTEGGFLLRLAPWADVAELVALMRCHQAFAAATGYSKMPFCPLYVPGLSVERRGRGVFFGVVPSRGEELARRLAAHVSTEAPTE